MKIAFIFDHPYDRQGECAKGKKLHEFLQQLETAYAGLWQAITDGFRAESFLGEGADRLHESQYWQNVEKCQGNADELRKLNREQMVRRANYQAGRVALQLAGIRAAAHCSRLAQTLDDINNLKQNMIAPHMNFSDDEVDDNNVAAAKALKEFWDKNQPGLSEKGKRDLTQGQGQLAVTELTRDYAARKTLSPDKMFFIPRLADEGLASIVDDSRRRSLITVERAFDQLQSALAQVESAEVAAGRASAWVGSFRFPGDVRVTRLNKKDPQFITGLAWPTRDGITAIASKRALSKSRQRRLALASQLLSEAGNGGQCRWFGLPFAQPEPATLLTQAVLYNWCVVDVYDRQLQPKAAAVPATIAEQNLQDLSAEMLKGLAEGSVPLPEGALKRGDFGDCDMGKRRNELGRIMEILRTDFGFSRELLQLVVDHCRQ